LTTARWGAGFSAVGRFVAEVEAAAAGKGQLQSGYVLAGDELFLLDRCREAVLKAFVPADLKDFCLSDLDLSSTSIFEVLDRAQTPSLMSPFQVIFVRNVRQLYTRGAKKDEFAALERYFRSPNPQALLIFVADFLRIPTDIRRMEMDDKNRFERIRETLGEHCGVVELSRVSEEDAMRWAAATAQAEDTRLEADAARELVDALGADMMLIASELEKLLLFTLGRGRITLGDVETMVLAAKQRSLYELTDAISSRNRARALALLQGLLNSSDAGEDAAMGHLVALTELVEHAVAGQHHGDRARGRIHAQRHHEGRQADIGDEDAVDRAGNAAGGEPGGEGGIPGIVRLQCQAAGDRDHPHDRADRQIDAAGDDHRGHADRHDADEGEVAGDVVEIVFRGEARLAQAHEQADHHQGDRDPEGLARQQLLPERLFPDAQDGLDRDVGAFGRRCGGFVGYVRHVGLRLL